MSRLIVAVTNDVSSSRRDIYILPKQVPLGVPQHGMLISCGLLRCHLCPSACLSIVGLEISQQSECLCAAGLGVSLFFSAAVLCNLQGL